MIVVMKKQLFTFSFVFMLVVVVSYAKTATPDYVADTAVNVTETTDTLGGIDPSLVGTLLDGDREKLADDRQKALDVLDNLGSDTYGFAERTAVRRLLMAKSMRVSNGELLSYRRVRSIQVHSLGIFSYPYFSCVFRRTDGKMFFAKTSGSQRKSGYIYDNTPTSKVFMGGWSVNDDPRTTYGSENSEAGMLYKIGVNKIIMLFVSKDGRSFELYELKK